MCTSEFKQIHIDETTQKRKFHASFSECTTPFYFHDNSIFVKVNKLKCRYIIIYKEIHLEEWRCKNLQCLLPRVCFI